MASTMRDVKNRTGLSMATISKYLNGGSVLPENKILIENAIKDLHYEVNEMARGLVKHQTKLVGVMVHDVESYFSGKLLHYIGQELRKHGYGMMSCDSCNDEKISGQQESRRHYRTAREQEERLSETGQTEQNPGDTSGPVFPG